jgi:uncharacterized protein YoxC
MIRERCFHICLVISVSVVKCLRSIYPLIEILYSNIELIINHVDQITSQTKSVAFVYKV